MTSRSRSRSASRKAGVAIEEVAKSVGLDMERARRIAASPAAEAEISRNYEVASRLGFSGTPSWVAGERLISGAVGIKQLAEAVEGARGS